MRIHAHSDIHILYSWTQTHSEQAIVLLSQQMLSLSNWLSKNKGRALDGPAAAMLIQSRGMPYAVPTHVLGP